MLFSCSVSEKQDAVPSQSVYPDAEDSSHVAVQEETQTPVGSTSSHQCFLVTCCQLLQEIILAPALHLL